MTEYKMYGLKHPIENLPTEELNNILKICDKQNWNIIQIPELDDIKQELRERKLKQLLN